MRRVNGMLTAAILMLLTSMSGIALALELVPCPDCEKPVSPRALLCPHCGCPGKAIQEAVAESVAAAKPLPLFPVASFETDIGEGTAVAYTDGEKRYLLMDALPLMGAANLVITAVNTNTPIPYHSMRVAAQAPVVRFETTATNLVFLTRASARTGQVVDPLWLHTDGTTSSSTPLSSPPRSVVALVNTATNLAAVFGRTTEELPIPVPAYADWIDITPKVFRDQTALLLDAQQRTVRKDMVAEVVDALHTTPWATPYFRQTAQKLIKLCEQEETNADP